VTITGTDREAWAARLYARLPEVYRTTDLEIARRRNPAAGAASGPLFQLLRAVAAQVASVRQDLDDLWDDFFIETADDWVVPYLADLLGTKLIQNAAGRHNRLDVRNTVLWRRSKGTPAMLAGLARDTTSWPTSFVEFFRGLAWTQNINHPRLDRAINLPLRDHLALDAIGRATDRFAHLADVRPAGRLDEPRTVRTVGAGTNTAPGTVASAAWGTPGRYRVRNVGFFVHRLQTFAVRGATPAPIGGDARTGGYTFDPLGRLVPLFERSTGAEITRRGLEAAPQRFCGTIDDHGLAGRSVDIRVRRAGVALAIAGSVAPSHGHSSEPFSFGDTSPVALAAVDGLRLLESAAFRQGGERFLLTAIWRTSAGDVTLGTLGTLEARLGLPAFVPGQSSSRAGRLVVRIETDPARAGRPAGGPGRFPATVLLVRDDVTIPRAAVEAPGVLSTRSAYRDALLVYLPDRFLTPGAPMELHVADDGSTYLADAIQPADLARESEGQLWPAADLMRPSVEPTDIGLRLHRRRGLIVPDRGRLSATPLLLEAHLMSGAPQLLGAIVTDDLTLDANAFQRFGDTFSALELPAAATTWTAHTFIPSKAAVRDDVGAGGQLLLRLRPLSSQPTSFSPQVEVVATDRGGGALLIYVPEVSFSKVVPDAWFFTATDGSTYRARVFAGSPAPLVDEGQLTGEKLARVGAGQVLPIEGTYPLVRRTIVSVPRERGLLVDPERGRFCLPENDPLLTLDAGDRDLTVEFVEAFSDRVGGRAFGRGAGNDGRTATRVVSSSGDALTPLPLRRIHATIADALTQAVDGEVVEIGDSATYREDLTIDLLGRRIGTLTLRASDAPELARPCLIPAEASDVIRVLAGNGERLELTGLLVDGSLRVEGYLADLTLAAATLDRGSVSGGQLVVIDEDSAHDCRVLVCRCITGALRLGAAVRRLVVADSIVDRREGLAIGGPFEATDSDGRVAAPKDAPAGAVQLERVTVLGRIRCDTLTASDALLAAVAWVDDRQSGCIRFSRFEFESRLPRRYRCVPSDEGTARESARVAFSSLVPASSHYAQLGAATASAVLSASADGDQVGAFARSYPTLRAANLMTKLREFLPAGLEPVLIAET